MASAWSRLRFTTPRAVSPTDDNFSPKLEFLDYQRMNRAFDRSIGISQTKVLWTGTGAPESFKAANVTGTSKACIYFAVPALLRKRNFPARSAL